jgi:hypothetical protein
MGNLCAAQNIDHSCSPNLVMKQLYGAPRDILQNVYPGWQAAGLTVEELDALAVIVFVAGRDIGVGVPMCFRYETPGAHGPGACLCGAPLCCGKIGCSEETCEITDVAEAPSSAPGELVLSVKQGRRTRVITHKMLQRAGHPMSDAARLKLQRLHKAR